MIDHRHHCPPPHAGTTRHPGLIGVFGGVINLTTTVLYSGARILRTVVEGAVWQDECPRCHCSCPQTHHVHHVKCEPEYCGRCNCC